MWEKIKDTLPYIIAIVCIIYAVYIHINSPTSEKVIERVVNTPVVTEVVRTENTASVSVQTKKNASDPDLVYNSKQTFDVELNGERFNLKPENKDTFEYGRDYVSLKQESKYNLSIDNKPLEPIWGVGVGISTNKKVAGIATLRLGHSPIHAWGMTDGETSAVGIMFSTNYK